MNKFSESMIEPARLAVSTFMWEAEKRGIATSPGGEGVLMNLLVGLRGLCAVREVDFEEQVAASRTVYSRTDAGDVPADRFVWAYAYPVDASSSIDRFQIREWLRRNDFRLDPEGLSFSGPAAAFERNFGPLVEDVPHSRYYRWRDDKAKIPTEIAHVLAFVSFPTRPVLLGSVVAKG